MSIKILSTILIKKKLLNRTNIFIIFIIYVNKGLILR